MGTYSGDALAGETDQLFANLGMGLGLVQTTDKFAYGLKAEINFLFGEFSVENKFMSYFPLAPSMTVEDDDALTGFLGRASGFVIVPLGAASGEANLAIEAGLRTYNWEIDGDSQSVWGPFVKAGVQWRF